MIKITNTSRNLFSGKLPKRRQHGPKEEQPEKPAVNTVKNETADTPAAVPEGTDVLKTPAAEGTDVLRQTAEGTDLLAQNTAEGTDILPSDANRAVMQDEGTAVLSASAAEGTDILNKSEATDVLERR